MNAQVLIAEFTRWLGLMNFDESSIKNDPRRVGEFFDYLSQNRVDDIDQITVEVVKTFFADLYTRKSRTGNPYSQSTIHTYRTSIRRFARYIKHLGGPTIEVPIHIRSEEVRDIVVLSRKEVERLYEATASDLLGMRDRAVLAIYYGCGLRRTEGVRLTLNDILLDSNVVFVASGKGNKERYVPMAGRVKKDIIRYLHQGRPMLLVKETHDQFFVGYTGKSLGGNALLERLKNLVAKAGIQKAVGLHTLRHSIATHLLQQGMSLTEIAQFLGHSNIDSTQIYTHLMHTNDEEDIQF